MSIRDLCLRHCARLSFIVFPFRIRVNGETKDVDSVNAICKDNKVCIPPDITEERLIELLHRPWTFTENGRIEALALQFAPIQTRQSTLRSTRIRIHECDYYMHWTEKLLFACVLLFGDQSVELTLPAGLATFCQITRISDQSGAPIRVPRARSRMEETQMQLWSTVLDWNAFSKPNDGFEYVTAEPTQAAYVVMIALLENEMRTASGSWVVKESQKMGLRRYMISLAQQPASTELVTTGIDIQHYYAILASVVRYVQKWRHVGVTEEFASLIKMNISNLPPLWRPTHVSHTSAHPCELISRNQCIAKLRSFMDEVVINRISRAHPGTLFYLLRNQHSLVIKAAYPERDREAYDLAEGLTLFIRPAAFAIDDNNTLMAKCEDERMNMDQLHTFYSQMVFCGIETFVRWLSVLFRVPFRPDHARACADLLDRLFQDITVYTHFFDEWHTTYSYGSLQWALMAVFLSAYASQIWIAKEPVLIKKRRRETRPYIMTTTPNESTNLSRMTLGELYTAIRGDQYMKTISNIYLQFEDHNAIDRWSLISAAMDSHDIGIVKFPSSIKTSAVRPTQVTAYEHHTCALAFVFGFEIHPKALKHIPQIKLIGQEQTTLYLPRYIYPLEDESIIHPYVSGLVKGQEINQHFPLPWLASQ